MVNQQLLDYIRQRLASGVSKDVIAGELSTTGWTRQDITEALVSLNIEQAPLKSPLLNVPQATPVAAAAPPSVSLENTSFKVDQSAVRNLAGIARVGFGPRFAAILLDVLATMVIGIGIGVFFGSVLGSLFFDGIGIFLGAFVGFVAGLFIAGVCNFLFEMLTGASLGKVIIGLTVANSNGSQASWPRLFARSCLKNIAFVCALLAVLTRAAVIYQIGAVLSLIIFIGAFMMLGSSRQALHDKIAGTAVFRRKDIFPAGSQRWKWPLIVGVLLLLFVGVGLVLVSRLVQQLPVESAQPSVVSNVEGTSTVLTQPTPVTSVSSSTSTSTQEIPRSTPSSTSVKTGQTSPTPAVTNASSFGLTALIPSSGSPGTKVTIIGSGFDPNGESIYFGNELGSSQDIGVTPTNSSTLTFSIPGTLFPCSIEDAMGFATSCNKLPQNIKAGTYKLRIIPFKPGATASNALTFTVTVP